MIELSDAEKVFLQDKVPAALLFIASSRITYISEVSEAIGSNFAHTKKVVTRLEKGGYISTFFQGRTRYLHLTAKGYHIAECIKTLMGLINTDGDAFAFPENPENSGLVNSSGRKCIGLSEENECDGVSEESCEFDEFDNESDGFNESNELNESNEFSEVISSENLRIGLLMERINNFLLRVRGIYELKISEGADTTSLRMALGPLDRELKLIKKEMNEKKIVNAELIMAYQKAEDAYNTYMGWPPSL